MFSDLEWFEFRQLPPHLQAVSVKFRALALDLAKTLPENEQSRRMFEKLLEAKDCGVRAAIKGAASMATSPGAGSDAGDKP